MTKSNPQKISEICSILGLEQKNNKNRRFFSMGEMSLIVKTITGKDATESDFRNILRKNIAGWTNQYSDDYIPTSKNLDIIIDALRNPNKEVNRAKVIETKVENVSSEAVTTITPIAVDWNMVVCKAIENNNVACIRIENGSVIIDFK